MQYTESTPAATKLLGTAFQQLLQLVFNKIKKPSQRMRRLLQELQLLLTE